MKGPRIRIYKIDDTWVIDIPSWVDRDGDYWDRHTLRGLDWQQHIRLARYVLSGRAEWA